jgi:hypothetical protein
MADDEKSTTELYCSFCGKSQHEVAKVIAAPGYFICNECVDLCVRFSSEKEAELRPPAAPPWDANHMERMLEDGNESEHTMFPWPQTDNPIEWLLGLIFGAVWSFLVWFWRAVAAIVTGRGTFAQWLWVSLLVAPAALVLGAAIANYALRH